MNNINEQTFTVITPCLNAEKTIREAILSVITQEGPFRIQYILVDGGSTDQTLAVIGKIHSETKSPGYTFPNLGVSMTVVSEPDHGMYDALAKGFRLASGDIISYLNSDDFYLPGAFKAVRDAFALHLGILWLSGTISVCNSDGEQKFRYRPYVFDPRFIRKGLYNGLILPFIPQESTFWHVSLLKDVDLSRLSAFSYAGDYYLWHEFSGHARLYLLQRQLASFRIFPGQRSSDKKRYRKELRGIASEKLQWKDVPGLLVHEILWHLPGSFKLRFHPYLLPAVIRD